MQLVKPNQDEAYLELVHKNMRYAVGIAEQSFEVQVSAPAWLSELYTDIVAVLLTHGLEATVSI